MMLEKTAHALSGAEGAPLHLQVKSAIAKALTYGTWKPGGKLGKPRVSLRYLPSSGDLSSASSAEGPRGRRSL
jgi:hypothetical protein